MPQASSKPLRTDPCPCGSGKRFKDCCGKLNTAAPSSPTAPATPASVVPPAWIEEAMRLHTAGDLDAACAMYTQVLATQPDDMNALQLLGAARLQTGQPAEAAALLSRALAQMTVPEWQLNLARALAELGDHVEALRHLQKAVAARPHLGPAHAALGVSLAALGLQAQAEQAFRTALRLEPGNALALINLGQTLVASGRRTEARLHYESVLALQPNHPEVAFNLANLYEQEGEFPQAIAAYQQALHYRPGYARAWLNLGHLHFQAQSYGEAVACFTEALASPQEATHAHRSLVKTLEAMAHDPDTPLPDLAPAPHPSDALPPLAGKLSIVVCSHLDSRFAPFAAHLDAGLAGEDWELIRIADARSLAEGYTRGLAQASGELVVLCHDDIEFITPDWPQQLRRALAHFDLVGVAGTTRLIGSAWSFAGWPHLRGRVVHGLADGRYALSTYSLDAGDSSDIQALDGVFMACRRVVLDAVPFDADTFDGFHLYDLDFSFRAHQAGFRLGVAGGIVLSHASQGRFDSVWQHYGARFLAKHTAALAQVPPGEFEYGGVLLQDGHALQRFLALSNTLTPPPLPEAQTSPGVAAMLTDARRQFLGATAANLVERLAASDGESDALLRLRALVAAERQLGSVAEPLLRRCLQQNPRDADVLLALGRILETEGRFDDARSQYEALTAASPGLAEGWRARARLAHKCHQWPEVIASAREALLRDPERPLAALEVLIPALVHSGANQEAMDLLADHARRRPGDPRLLTVMSHFIRSVATPQEAELYRRNALSDEWLRMRRRFDRLSAPRKAALQTLATRLADTGPLVSLVLVVQNARLDWLGAAVESIRTQLYPHWELWLVNDGAPAHLAGQLQALAARDARIKVLGGALEEGRVVARNTGLAAATGDVIAFPGEHDCLEPQALLRIAQAVQQHDPDWLYSDEIMVDEDDFRVVDHAFRPAFSLERLRSFHGVVHLSGFKTAFLRQLDGFDPTFPQGHELDLQLRAAESARRIVHIPEALYRWRLPGLLTPQQATGFEPGHSIRALVNHLSRCGERARVDYRTDEGFYHLQRPRERDDLRIAVIIPSKEQGALVQQCVHSLRRTTAGQTLDILVVDHDSQAPESLAAFEALRGEGVEILRHTGPFNFSAINNRAVAHLAGRGHSHYLFCNNDIEALQPGWLEAMIGLAQRPDVGVVGAKLLYPDRRTVQHNGVAIGLYGVAEHYGKFTTQVNPDDRPAPGYLNALRIPHEVSAVTAAFLLVSANSFEAVAGFDEILAVGFGDIDLCLRIRARGQRVLMCPQATLVHHESYSRGKHQGFDPHPADTRRFLARWAQMLRDGDPYYNPNLSLHSTGWRLDLAPLLPACPTRLWERPQ